MKFKIEKTVVKAKARTLTATWTLEESQIIKTLGIDILEEAELDIKRSVTGPLLVEQGWTEVYIGSNWRKVTNEWCEKNLTGQYHCMGVAWFFENKEDAAWFMVRWS